MQVTEYFKHTRDRPGREWIQLDWIERVLNEPDFEQTQKDGRIRLWKVIPEANNRYLRVIVLADRLTVHNAFFDRSFEKTRRLEE